MEPVMKIDYKATYEKYKDIAVVDFATFYNRMRHSSKAFTIERALMTEVHDLKRWAEKAEENGISRSTFYRRIKNGWMTKDAATFPVNEKFKNKEHIEEELGMEREIKLLLKAGIPIRKNKYVDFINNNKELFEGMI